MKSIQNIREICNMNKDELRKLVKEASDRVDILA